MAKYEDVTIANAEAVIKTGYVEEIVCDGDKKEIYVSEEAQANAKIKLEEVIQLITDAFIALGNSIVKVTQQFANIAVEIATSMKNKKLTKKKFMKLLQSQGIQPNEIRQIVKNNKEPYTYIRYYNIVNEFLKNKQCKNKKQ